MAIDITAAGSAGTHSFRKVNVDTVDNYVYSASGNFPAGINQGASYIYTSGIGSIGGIAEGELVYANFDNDRVLKFLDDQDAEISFTSATPGGTSYNFPIVYDNILNISTPPHPTKP